MNRPLPSLCLLALSTLATGCGPNDPETIPVQGTVMLDGNPVPGAKVYGCGTEGKTGPDGTAQVQAYDWGVCRIRTSYRHWGRFDPAEHAGGTVEITPQPRKPSDYDPVAEA